MANKAPAKAPRPKHVPQRTCVACRTTGTKRGLVRLVKTTEGAVHVDETGKKSGRGAYLCKTAECWSNALNGKALQYALKTAISVEDKAALQAYAATLNNEEQEPGENA
ncbi:MAG: YlxR family protein [Chloroflexia bacterium]